MTIRLNARPQQWKAETLMQAFSGFWKNARNARMAGSEAGYLQWWKNTVKTKRAVQKLLGTNTVADFQTPFRATFVWDATEWNDFRASAVLVYGTLIPDALAAVAAVKAKLTDTDLDADGEIVFSSPLTAQEKVTINAALQAIEDQYSLAG